jgi:hypothetical protein
MDKRATELANAARQHVESIDNLEVLVWVLQHSDIVAARNRVAVAALDVLHVFIRNRLTPEAAQISAALNSEKDATDAGQ